MAPGSPQKTHPPFFFFLASLSTGVNAGFRDFLYGRFLFLFLSVGCDSAWLILLAGILSHPPPL